MPNGLCQCACAQRVHARGRGLGVRWRAAHGLAAARHAPRLRAIHVAPGHRPSRVDRRPAVRVRVCEERHAVVPHRHVAVVPEALHEHASTHQGLRAEGRARRRAAAVLAVLPDVHLAVGVLGQVRLQVFAHRRRLAARLAARHAVPDGDARLVLVVAGLVGCGSIGVGVGGSLLITAFRQSRPFASRVARVARCLAVGWRHTRPVCRAAVRSSVCSSSVWQRLRASGLERQHCRRS